jgi:hypothetical protein
MISSEEEEEEEEAEEEWAVVHQRSPRGGLAVDVLSLLCCVWRLIYVRIAANAAEFEAGFNFEFNLQLNPAPPPP